MKRIFTLLAAILIIGLFSCKKSSPESILEGRWILEKQHSFSYGSAGIYESFREVPELDKNEFNFSGNHVTIKFNYPAQVNTTTYRMVSNNQIEFENYFYEGWPLEIQRIGLNEFTLTTGRICGYEINHYKRIN